ncbi:cobalamin biosynthesis protein [Shimia thalassica]|uniref:cobalamin biosynthesis protein n=1 Tax=Shimia thalassica TaxID=1715693 RepID=UPI0026E3B1AB|nr:cobalamin biosynthesis protein [Shimia thalassica]MDO6481379.1 cobalamin biosynthesis protein [Shimia thalassica]
MIVAGFGFRGAATVASLRDALAQTDGPQPDAYAVPDDKARTPAFVAFAAETRTKVVPVTARALQNVQTPTQAERVLEKRGTGSVAEACALVAAGPKAALLTTRHISHDRMATCALAIGDST